MNSVEWLGLLIGVVITLGAAAMGATMGLQEWHIRRDEKREKEEDQ